MRQAGEVWLRHEEREQTTHKETSVRGERFKHKAWGHEIGYVSTWIQISQYKAGRNRS